MKDLQDLTDFDDGPDRLVFYCRTTSTSTAPCTSRRTCFPTHGASRCAPCQLLWCLMPARQRNTLYSNAHEKELHQEGTQGAWAILGTGPAPLESASWAARTCAGSALASRVTASGPAASPDPARASLCHSTSRLQPAGHQGMLHSFIGRASGEAPWLAAEKGFAAWTESRCARPAWSLSTMARCAMLSTECVSSSAPSACPCITVSSESCVHMPPCSDRRDRGCTKQKARSEGVGRTLRCEVYVATVAVDL